MEELMGFSLRAGFRCLLLVLLFGFILFPDGSTLAQKQLTAKDMKRLYKLLETSDHYKVRSKTCRVLGMLRRPEAIPHLIKALRHDPDHFVRSVCAQSLGSLNHPGTILELKRASKKDVALVKRGAQKALRHILASFPENMPSRGEGLFRLSIDDLKDNANRKRELTPWVQQYFAEKLINFDNIELGSEMNIEEDGEKPDIAESFEPVIVFSLKGGVSKVDIPPDRGPGQVKVAISVELVLEPVDIKAVKMESYSASARFAGGEKPSDPWADDPLLEAEKKALKLAVGKAHKIFGKFLRLEK